MNKIFNGWNLLAIGVIIIAASALAIQEPGAGLMGAIDLPVEAEAGITAAVVWLVSLAVTQLILAVPFLAFLEKYKEPLALGIAAELISQIEGLVPAEFGEVAVAAITLLLAILALFKVGAVWRENKDWKLF